MSSSNAVSASSSLFARSPITVDAIEVALPTVFWMLPHIVPSGRRSRRPRVRSERRLRDPAAERGRDDEEGKDETP